VPILIDVVEKVKQIPYSAAYDSLFPVGALAGGAMGGNIAGAANYIGHIWNQDRKEKSKYSKRI
jgi:hypothetical protein